jgi:prepilin-type N-terminal cleavage/methylation domain-containing protein
MGERLMQNLPQLLRQNKNKKAFTLIEVLVSVVILSVILTIFYSTWYIGMKATRRSHQIAQKYMGARVFLDSLAKELRSAFEFNYMDYKNFVWIPDENKKRLEFWGTAPDEVPVIYTYPFPIHRYVYYIKEEDNKKVIYKRVEPVYINYPQKYKPIEGPVLAGDFDFDIEPIYAPGKIPKTLPEKVIVTLTIEGVQKLQKVVYINGLKSLQ